MGDLVTFEVDEATGVGTIKLNRPPMNAINWDLLLDLQAAVNAAASDERCRAVVLWGGDKVFAAGADINQFVKATPLDMMKVVSLGQGVLNQLEEMPKVVIAAITGYALGGGCEIALACDFRVMAYNAFVGQPEILLGVIPGFGGTQRLPRLIGTAKAKELILSGRMLKAFDAQEIGLVDATAPAEELLSTAKEMAARYAKGPSVAIRAAKVAINRGMEMDLANGQILERELFATLFATEDQKIGATTFLEKGPGKAKFVGR